MLAGGCALLVGNLDGTKVFAGVEASTDGGARTGDAGPSPCLEKHTFCDDFDHETTLGADWSSVNGPLRAYITMDDQESVSPPNSLHVTVPAAAECNASLTETLQGPITSLHCEVDLRVDSEAEGGTANVIDFGFSAGGPYGFGFAVGAMTQLSAGVFYDGGSVGRIGNAPTPPLGQWTHLTLVATPPTGEASLSYGNPAFTEAMLTGLPVVPSDDDGVQVTLGISSPFNVVSPIDIRFDNFWCDVTP
jgi:hypothetical protein